jgi:hypothetical protein
MPAEVRNPCTPQRCSPRFRVELTDWISPVTEHVYRMLSNLFAKRQHGHFG